MGRPRVMREGDLGRMDAGESLREEMGGVTAYMRGLEETAPVTPAAIEKIKDLIRSSKTEARFVGGLNERQMKTFYLIDSRKVAEILGEEP